MIIKHILGDATMPEGEGPKVIVHVCNDLGKWGKGFVLAISRRWKTPEDSYRKAFSSPEKPALGDVQFVAVSDTITVANLIGQHGVARKGSRGEPPIRYLALRQGLEKVATFALAQGASVHMPRIGCGLAGGTWDKIEPLIHESLLLRNIPVFVYDLA